MSLTDLEAIGSFVSGIAVVFSFIFLALQVRQSNRNQRSLIQQGRTGRTVDILLKMADPPISEALAEADADYGGMSPSRIWSFYGFAAAVFWTYEDSYLQLQAGTIDPQSWDSDVTTLRRLIGFAPYRVVWRMARDGMSGGYRDYVDSLMSEIPVDPSRRFGDLFKSYIAEELAAGRRR